MFGCVALAPSGSIGNGMREVSGLRPVTSFLIFVPKRPEVWCSLGHCRRYRAETILARDVRKI